MHTLSMSNSASNLAVPHSVSHPATRERILWKVEERHLPDGVTTAVSIIRYTLGEAGEYDKAEIFTDHGWQEFQRFDVLPFEHMPTFGRDSKKLDKWSW